MSVVNRANLIEKIDELYKKLSARRPFCKDLLAQMRKFYRVTLTWSSNAIEGSSYTESETRLLLEDGITVAGKTLFETFAAIGHAKAFDYMMAIVNQKFISENDILKMHEFLEGALESGDAGHYRNVAVFVTGTAYKFPQPRQVPKLMSNLFNTIVPGLASEHPVVMAARLHEELTSIHPFADGNGRVARLAMNTVLLQHGYMPVQIHPVIRKEYIDSLRCAEYDNNDFICLILQQEIESQKEVLRFLEEESADPCDNAAPQP